MWGRAGNFRERLGIGYTPILLEIAKLVPMLRLSHEYGSALVLDANNNFFPRNSRPCRRLPKMAGNSVSFRPPRVRAMLLSTIGFQVDFAHLRVGSVAIAYGARCSLTTE